jgi:hypothetical protein
MIAIKICVSRRQKIICRLIAFKSRKQTLMRKAWGQREAAPCPRSQEFDEDETRHAASARCTEGEMRKTACPRLGFPLREEHESGPSFRHISLSCYLGHSPLA